MNKEYTITQADARIAIVALVQRYNDIVRYGEAVDDETLPAIDRLIDAFENADRIVIAP